jgi:NAD(P)-dependent dehydrogenase (short-subunit alcohol dehydrogenase family)
MSAAEPRVPAAARVVLVTGASSGIGRATAARLADAGHVVFAAARRASALDALAAEHPNARPVVLDVTEQASIDNALEQVQAATDGRGPDVVVNAAGTMLLGPAAALPEEQVRAQFDVNVFGLLAVTRAFVPQMRERGAGRIVNISSILGRFALPGTGPYSASKFAVEACSDALRMELAPYGVLVVLVEPGATDTSLYQAASTALPDYQEALESYRSTWAAGFDFPQRLLRPAATADRVATEVVRAALASRPRARYQPGVRTRMRTRLLTALPTRAADQIKRRLAGVAATPHAV